MSEIQKNKEKKWQFFAIGIVVGIVICCAVLVVNELARNHNQSFPQVIKHIYMPGREKDTVVKFIHVTAPATAEKKAAADSLSTDSLSKHDDYESNTEDWEEVEFSITDEDAVEDEDIVIVNKIVGEKTVKVHHKNAEWEDMDTPADGVAYFEVQQWNTPIKNRISYHRENQVLQLKGISLDKVSIISYNKHCYLQIDNNHYGIENNEGFERLVPVQLPHGKK